MTETRKVDAMFGEVRATYDEAIKLVEKAEEYWDRDLLRMSAGKTWDAAIAATNTLIEVRAGIEAKKGDDDWTYDCLIQLVWDEKGTNQDLKAIKLRYGVISADIYKAAVVEGNVEPVHLLIHDIRKTAEYIRECERLASVREEG